MKKKPETISEYEAVQETVKMDLIKEKQDEKAKNDADGFLSALEQSGSMMDESKKKDLTVNSTGLFKRSDPLPLIGYESKIAAEAFLLSEEKKVPDNVIKGQKGYYVIQFKDKKEPDTKGFDEEKTELKEMLLQQKKQITFEAMISQLKSKSEILIEDRFKE